MRRAARFASAGIALGSLSAAVVASAEPARPPAPERADAAPVRILIESPDAGEVVRNEIHQAPLRGRALAQEGHPVAFDVMVVIDISGSTRSASGVDVDGDGEIGVDPSREPLAPGPNPPTTNDSTDPGDSILAAEVRAAEALLDTLEDGGNVRVGIVSFAGEMNPDTGKRLRYDQQDAWVEMPLSSSFGPVRRRLREILARGPYGGTNFAAGLRVAITELAGLSNARSTPRDGAAKIALFLTDGLPTFPVGRGSKSDPGDVEAALAAARVARRAGITVNTYALGPTALSNPRAATEIARLTEGTFLPVQKPGDIVSFLQGTSFVDVEDVVFTNLTTREVSTDVRLAPDGSFSGFVPVREGSNRVRVTALTADGASTSVELDLEFERAGGSQRELALELERIRERNKQLMLLIERERIQSFRERQRKELEVEVEPGPEAEDGVREERARDR